LVKAETKSKRDIKFFLKAEKNAAGKNKNSVCRMGRFGSILWGEKGKIN